MPRPRSDIQGRILLAAHARFLAEGVEAASLRQIAKDAETSIGMVYYYYTTKDDLFLAVVEEIYQKFLEDLESIWASRHSFQERLCSFYSRIGAMSKAEFEVLHLIIRESLTSHDRRQQLKQRFLRGHLPLLMRAIVEALNNGEIDRSLHPMVAMACTLGFTGASTMLMQVVRQMTGQCAKECPDPSVAPDFMRDIIRSFCESLPTCDQIAEQMSRIVVKATAPERD